MAASLLLLLLVSACAAELGFQRQPKRQYTYLYEAKQASGIPGLQSQWSAIGMKMKVTIQVANSDGQLYFKLENLQQGELKNVLTQQPWRKNFSIPYSPVQQDLEALSRVFKVQLKGGVISKFITSADEPIWVVNIKKSIAQMFQLDLQKQQTIDVPSMAQPRSYQSGQEAEFFRVMEDSIGGECETLYETTPRLPQNLKADMLQELSILSQSSLPGIQVPSFDRFQPFIVTKTKNYQNCQSRPNWQHMTPGVLSCGGDDCHLTASNRSTSARYVLDGDRSSFKIQYVVAESEARMLPYGHETEQLWTVTNQTLFLQQEESIPRGSFFGEPQRPKTYEKLDFQYPTADKKELQMPDLKAPPQLSTHIPGAPVELIQKKQNPSQLITIVKDTIIKVDQLMNHVADPVQEDVAGYVIEIERALSWLSYDQLSQVYSQLPRQEQKNIYWDILALTGTNPAVMQIVDGIHSKQIEETRLATILSTLPINIQTPTKDLLEKLFIVYQSETDQSKKQSHMNMALSLGNIFYQICTSNTTVYSQSLYQQHFCSYETKQLIRERFIPQLEREIQAFEQMETQTGLVEPYKFAYIQALGNIGDRYIIPALTKLVTKQKTPQVASKAIYAFYRVVTQYPETVRKILSPIFHDVSRPTEVRLAAVTMLLSTNPPIEYWQKVATSTWFEPSQEVGAFIHRIYRTLAKTTKVHVQQVQVPDIEMSRRARTTMTLIRPPQGGFAFFSGKYEYNQRSGQRLIGLNGVHLSVRGAQKIFEDIMGISDDQSSMPHHPRNIYSSFQQPTGMSKSMKLEKFQGSLYTQVMGAIDTFFACDESCLDQIRENFHKGGVKTKSQIQKIAYLEDLTVTFPSEIGMPIIYSKKMPIVASARGRMSFEWSWTNRQYHVSIKNAQPFVAVKSLVTVSTVSPFSLRSLGAGVENKAQVSLPMSLEAKLDLQTKNLHIEVEPVQQPSVVKVAHIQTLPFTTAVEVTSYENIVRSPDTKEIKTTTTKDQKTDIKVPFGKTFGLDGYLRLIADYPIINFGTFWTQLQKQGYAGVTSWFTMGSLRSRHYDMVIDTSASNFQKLDATFSYEKSQQPTRNVNVRTYVATTIISQKNGGAQHYRSQLKLTHDLQWLSQKLAVLVKSPSKSVNLDVTLQFPDMSDSREELLRSDMKASVSASISDESQQQQPIIRMQGFARRDEVAKKYAMTCAEALRCAEHERIGNPNSADCRLAKNYAALANHYELIFSGYQVPQSLKKASYSLEKFVQYALWQYMRSYPFLQNPQNQVNVTIQLDPYKNGMNLNISTPSENTTFAEVPLPFNMLHEPGLLTMRKPIQKKLVDSFYGIDKTVCLVDKRVVKTFDNVTLERQPSDCWTLLMSNSSEVRQLAVYEKVVNQQSVVSIQVDSDKIEIDSANLGQVKVNGRPQRLSYATPVIVRDSTGRKTLVQVLMLTHRPEAVKVQLPQHFSQLLVTKEGVQIQASMIAYRNYLQGVCGDFNGEQQDDMTGPDGCIYKEGPKFYQAYWHQTGNQCKPPTPPVCPRKPDMITRTL